MSVLKLGTTVPGGAAFKLPLELVTQSIAILAKRGVGKTYTAAVLCEEIHDAGVPPVIIDPTGAHWGLKASADGKRAGLPFVVFGGEHADLPLEEYSGEVIARAIIEQRFPAILDLSLFRKGAMHRFLVGFFETLYRLNRQALHLVCDEADAYAPQKPYGDEARTLGAMQDIVRRGRIRGIGCTLITQRPQVLNKDVLTQCEVLVTLRLVHPKDIGAIEDWIAVHGDPSVASKLIASLPSLPVGTAWFWAPGFGDLFERVQIRQRRTFDSSATPKPGEARVAPEKFAEIDLSRLGTEINAAAQRAKDNDPAELKREIARLKSELGKQPAAPSHQQLESARNEGFAEAKARTLEAHLRIASELAEIRKTVCALHDFTSACVTPGNGAVMALQDIARRPQVARAPIASRPAAGPAIVAAGFAGELSKAERRVLTVLAQHPNGCEKGKLALLAGYSYSGGFRNTLSALRTSGHIAGGNEEMMRITPAGREVLGGFDPLPSGRELAAYWLSHAQFGAAERAVLSVLIENPEGFSGPELAKASGYEFSGGFRNTLSTLRTAGVIVGKNGAVIRASEELLS
jgi:uncharacterized protein